MTLAIDQALKQIEKAQGIADLWALMVDYYRAAGFQAVGYVRFAGFRRGQITTLLESGYPPDLVSTFERLGFGRHAPMFRLALSSGRPQLRSAGLRQARLSRIEAEHAELVTASGVGETLNLPLFGPVARNGVVVVALAREPDCFHERHWQEFQLVAQAVHLRSFAVEDNYGETNHDLSQREIEILRWVAQGKSNSVISDILEISSATVDTYLRRVFDKLDVADRTSAAVKGVSMGLIRA